MKTPLPFLRAVLLLVLVALSHGVQAQYDLVWTKPPDLNENLPPSIEVYQTTSPLVNSPNKAFYTIFDPKDPNVEFVIRNVTGTPHAIPWFIEQENAMVYSIINGGFFSVGTAAVADGLVIEDGKVEIPTNTKVGSYYPTRSAFGMHPDNTPDMAWVYSVGSDKKTYRYSQPNPLTVDGVPSPEPTATSPEGATPWNPEYAIAAAPRLVHKGQKFVAAEVEMRGADDDTREPRTAVGYMPDGRVVFLVVEGRNPGIAMGATFNDLAEIFLNIGCVEAMNLDGGGSSGMDVLGKKTIRPSDGGVYRLIPNVLMVKRRSLIFDTENTASVTQTGGSWAEGDFTDAYGSSKSLTVATGDGSQQMKYNFTGIAPARYEIAAWWPKSASFTTKATYKLYREGVSEPVVIAVDQTRNGGAFNSLGSFDLGPNDYIVLSNEGAGGTVAADAVRLLRVGESTVSIGFDNGVNNSAKLAEGATMTVNALLKSPNTGITLATLDVFRRVNGGAEEQVGEQLNLENKLTAEYAFTEEGNLPLGTKIEYRFILKDNRGQSVEQLFSFVVSPSLQIVFEPQGFSGEHAAGKPLSLKLIIDTKHDNVHLQDLTVFRSVNGSEEAPYGDPVTLSGSRVEHNFTYDVHERAGSEIDFRFVVKYAGGELAEEKYHASIIPDRGAIRVAVISDLNSSFGDVTYEWQVDSIMQRIPRLWKPDLVLTGGDMVAGQSTALTNEQVANMWAGFDKTVASPLRKANIPLAFTLGNHDAAKGYEIDRTEAANYWNNPANKQNWYGLDVTNYPFYYTFKIKEDSEVFFMAWEASSGNISDEQLEWVKEQLSSPEAKAAKQRILVGHLPLYSVAQVYNSAGNVISNGDKMRQLLEEYGVDTYVSGHHHAYYPAKRGNMELLNAGAAGAGPRVIMSTDVTSPNTVTLMDIFPEQDTVIYTTYEIKHEVAENMPVFNEKTLPSSLFGINGYMVRRDVHVSGTGEGMLSSLHHENSELLEGTGTVEARQENDKIIISGTFSNLAGKLLPEKTSVALYAGLYPEQGKLHAVLNVVSTDGQNGTFSGEIPATVGNKELMSVGALYVLIKTEHNKAGELRTQLYLADNEAPQVTAFTSHTTEETYPVRNNPAFFSVKWNRSTDKDHNPVTYTYQLAKDAAFTDILVSKSVGLATVYHDTQEAWFERLGEATENEVLTFYHRVLASDGKNLTYGPVQALNVAKSVEPVVGPIEVLPPNFVWDCLEKDNEGNCITPFTKTGSSNGHGVAVDRKGRVWNVSYGYGLIVNNPDGSPYPLTSDKLTLKEGAPNHATYYTLNGNTVEFKFQRGVGIAHDGNILIVNQNNTLVKFDSETGEPIASWVGPTSWTNPTSDKDGRVFVTSVAGNLSMIVKQSETDPTTFEVVKDFGNSLERPAGAIARAATISPEGRDIYVPYLTGNRIDHFRATDEAGLDFQFLEKIDIPYNTKSIYAAGEGKLYFVTDIQQAEPAKLIMRDESNPDQIISWTVPLHEITSQDLRGVSLTTTQDTAYIVSHGNYLVYRYLVPKDGVIETPEEKEVVAITIADAREIDENGVAVRFGENVSIQGTVNSENLSQAALDFIFTEEGKGLQVYNTYDNLGYTPKPGDMIEVKGILRQNLGMTRLEATSVEVISSEQTLASKKEVQVITDAEESYPVALATARLDNVAEWTTGSGYYGFEVNVTNADGSFKLFIPAESETAYNLPAPTGDVLISGVVQQLSVAAPHTSGYYIAPRSASDLTFVQLANTEKLVYCAGDVIELNYELFNVAAGTPVTAEMSDASGSFESAVQIGTSQGEASGKFAVSVPADVEAGNYKFRLKIAEPALYSQELTLSMAPVPAPEVIANGDELTTAEAETYQWYLNGEKIEGEEATQQTYVAMKSGKYAVEVSRNGCFAISEEVNVISTSTGPEVQARELKVYPNPTSDVLHVALPQSFTTNVTIEIVDVLGKVLKVEKLANGSTATTLDLKELTNGLYFVRISNGDERIIKRVVKR